MATTTTTVNDNFNDSKDIESYDTSATETSSKLSFKKKVIIIVTITVCVIICGCFVYNKDSTFEEDISKNQERTAANSEGIISRLLGLFKDSPKLKNIKHQYDDMNTADSFDVIFIGYLDNYKDEEVRSYFEKRFPDILEANQSYKRVSLHYAVEKLPLFVTRYLVEVEDASVDSLDDKGFTALQQIIQNNAILYPEIFEYFIDHGADKEIKCKSNGSKTILYLVAEKEKYPFFLVDKLIKMGCDVNAVGDRNVPLLQSLVSLERKGVVEHIINSDKVDNYTLRCVLEIIHDILGFKDLVISIKNKLSK